MPILMLWKRITFWLALVGILLGARIVLAVAAHEPLPAPPLPVPAKPFPHGIGASGLVEAQHRNTSIGVPNAGVVTKVFVDVWDRVQPGTPLLQLDDRELRAQLSMDLAQIKLKSTQADRALAQLNRLQAIRDPRVISADDLKDRQLDVTVAQADLATAQAKAQQTEQLIDRLTVRSPIEGTVLQVNVRVGEYITPSAVDASLVLGNIDAFWVRADVDEQIAPRVKAGKRAVGYLKGDATHPIPMEFVRIEPYVIPKRSLTGASTERVDTRVLQVIYTFHLKPEQGIYVGQQIDLFIEDAL